MRAENLTSSDMFCYKFMPSSTVDKKSFEKAVAENAALPAPQEESKVDAPVFIGTRKLTEVDVAVVEDLQNEFNIDMFNNDLSKQTMLFTSGANSSANVDKAMSIMRKHLSTFMKSEGIADVPPIELSNTRDGSVILISDHPEKEKIEGFFNDNFELRNLFVGITSTNSLIAIAKESAKFQQRYAIDPKAAVEEFAHLFSDRYQYHSSLAIESGTFTLNIQGRYDLSAS